MCSSHVKFGLLLARHRFIDEAIAYYQEKGFFEEISDDLPEHVEVCSQCDEIVPCHRLKDFAIAYKSQQDIDPVGGIVSAVNFMITQKLGAGFSAYVIVKRTPNQPYAFCG